MSQTTIRRRFKIDGVLADADAAVFADPAGEYGVRRTDTGASVVALNTALTRVSVGLYSHTFTDPAPGLEYEFYIRFTYGSETYFIQDSIGGGRDGNLYDLIPRIVPFAGGVPDAFLKQRLREAAVDFCRDTELWREDLDAIDSEAGEDEYDLDHGYDAEILRVRAVTYDATPWAFEVDEAALVLTLIGTPSQSDLDIIPSVTFLPRESCVVYPAWLLTKWGRAIIELTVSRLCAMQGRVWFNDALAAESRERYRELVCKAKVETMTQRGTANVQVQRRRFV